MKILIDHPIHEPGLATLKSLAGLEIDCIEATHAGSPPQPLPAPRIAGVEVLLCQKPPPNLADMHSLKWMQISSTGYDQLIGLGLAERGIRATTSRGCFDVQIAEWNVSMMIN